MKLLLFCDVHGDENIINNLVKKANQKKVDAIICAGDISEFGNNLIKIVKKFDIGIPLYMIPGNHETDEEIAFLDSKFSWFENFHLKVKKIEDTLLIGCGGGGLSKFHTPFEKSEKYFKRELKQFKNLNKSILVTHAPPYNTFLDFINNEHVGVKSIRRFIEKEQPGIAICGHLHENSGMEDKIKKTIIINPGDKGKIIEI